MVKPPVRAWTFIPAWTALTLAGWIVGASLGELIAPLLGGRQFWASSWAAAVWTAQAAVNGLVLGATQCVMVRRINASAAFWVVATAGGWCLGEMADLTTIRLVNGRLGGWPHDVPVAIHRFARWFVTGLATGGLQYAAFRRTLNTPSLWIAMSAILWTVAGMWFHHIQGEFSFGIEYVVAGSLVGVVQALALLMMMMQKGERPEAPLE